VSADWNILSFLPYHVCIPGAPRVGQVYRLKFPDRYVENYTTLARVIRLEADVKHSLATPETVDEALAQLESKVGKKSRRKFEKFLRELGELDDEDDMIDIESK